MVNFNISSSYTHSGLREHTWIQSACVLVTNRSGSPTAPVCQPRTSVPMFPPYQHSHLIQYIQPLVMHTSHPMSLNADPPGCEPHGKSPHTCCEIFYPLTILAKLHSYADRILGSLSMKIWYGHDYLSIYTSWQNVHKYD